MTFTVKSEQLLAVIGPVGAGKVCHITNCQLYLVFHNIVYVCTVFVFVNYLHFNISPNGTLLCQSSLLSAILGELSQESGLIKVKGELSYTSQLPWILPGTIRGNILFGKEFDAQKYHRVLRACALKRVRIPSPCCTLSLYSTYYIYNSSESSVNVNDL